MAPTPTPPENAVPAASAGRGRSLAVLGAVVAAAGVLRALAAGGDLWLDEIWSLDNLALARARAGGVREWLALFFHDNTHALNTLWLALVGPGAAPFAYRALSWASGTASVALAGMIGWRRSPLEAVIAAAVVGLSYPLVHYAGEARGYAPMMLAALAAFHLIETWPDRPAPGRALAFLGVTVVGLAAHATFVLVLLGLAVWRAAALYRRLGEMVPTLARLVPSFGVQAVLVVAYGAVAWTNFAVGGGRFLPAAESVNAMAAYVLGLDPAPAAWGGGIAASALGLGVAAATAWIWRRGEPAWLFFAVVALAYPLAFVIADPPLGTVPRYFIASALFATLLLARGLAAAVAAGGRARAAAGAALILFAAGQGVLLQKFLAAGRGDFSRVVRTIAAAGPGPARVAGYHPFSVGTVLGYHARALGLADRVRFQPPAAAAAAPADWYIDGRAPGAPPPAPEITPKAAPGTSYALIEVFPHWGLSGDTWALYRRRD